jgi:tetraacyldisaccharide 4'-kinase
MNWLEHHWYRITPLHLLLFPISLVFRMLVALRRELYRNGILTSHQLLLPVIVVGNISVGGTGKTPLTLALAQQLIERGWHPLIVSRGYGRTISSPQPVSLSSTTAQVGDEPLLMAQRDICPVWVGADRVATARAALQARPQCDVVLCDDGLQHYRLQRDAEIAVIDGARGFGNGLMLPAGPLREPVSRLQTVDAVVVNVQARNPRYALPHPTPLDETTSHSTDETTSHPTKQPKDGCQVVGYRLPKNAAKSLVIPEGEGANESLREFQFDGGNAATSEELLAGHPGQYAMRLTGAVFYNLLNPGQVATPADFHKPNNHAVAGIGHPQRYFQHLETLGIPFTPHAFPDHHPYRAADLSFTDCDALLLTEKDAVKCAAFADARYWVLRVDAQIDPALIDHILRKIALHGHQTA